MIAHFVYIGRIVVHHCLNFLFSIKSLYSPLQHTHLDESTLNKTIRTIKNRQIKDKGNIGYKTQNEDKQNKNKGNIGYKTQNEDKQNKNTGNIGYKTQNEDKQNKNKGNIGYKNTE